MCKTLSILPLLKIVLLRTEKSIKMKTAILILISCFLIISILFPKMQMMDTRYDSYRIFFSLQACMLLIHKPKNYCNLNVTPVLTMYVVQLI